MAMSRGKAMATAELGVGGEFCSRSGASCQGITVARPPSPLAERLQRCFAASQTLVAISDQLTPRVEMRFATVSCFGRHLVGHPAWTA